MKKLAAAAFASAMIVIVGLGATSFACTSLATMNLSKATGAVGETLTVTGSSFKLSTPTAPAPAVAIHWNSLSGPVVAQATTDATGTFTATFVVPESQPGNYVVIARQLTAEGKDQYGTPARASFQVQGPGTQLAEPPDVSTRAITPATSDSSGVIALALGLGALGLVLFGGGFMAVVRQTRRQPVPARAAVNVLED